MRRGQRSLVLWWTIRCLGSMGRLGSSAGSIGSLTDKHNWINWSIGFIVHLPREVNNHIDKL